MTFAAMQKGELMDLIDRQEAIRTIEWWFGVLDQNPDILIDSIITLPSVQPERKKGKWILDDDGIPAICSECGTNWINDYVDSRELYMTGKIPNYCPECGSDNRGEQE